MFKMGRYYQDLFRTRSVGDTGIHSQSLSPYVPVIDFRRALQLLIVKDLLFSNSGQVGQRERSALNSVNLFLPSGSYIIRWPSHALQSTRQTVYSTTECH